MKNLKYRLISAAFIGLIFIIAIFFIRPLFMLLMLIIAGLMLAEWYNMIHASCHSHLRGNDKGYLFLGLIIIPIPIISLLYIAALDKQGWLLFTYFTLIWCVDSMAMFVGKTIQGPKLAPVLSPNKTISGLCGGVISAALLPLLLKLLPSYSIDTYIRISDLTLVLQCGLLAILAQISDLFISYFKRKFGIKDSGNIIPGHGGMLDRFDSIILTAPVLALYLISQGNFS